MNTEFPINTNKKTDASNAIIYVGGLFLLCFNKEDERAEVGYLNIDGHKAKVTIYEFEGNEYKAKYQNTSIQDKTLEIISDQSGVVELYNGADTNSRFNNLLRLEDVYGAKIEIDSEAKSKFSAKIFLDGLNLHTNKNLLRNVVGHKFGDRNDVSFTKTVSDGVIGTSTEGNTLKELRLDGNKVFTFDKDSKYRINFNSGCRSTAVQGDFHHFKDVLANSGDTKYNLRLAKKDNNLKLNDFEFSLVVSFLNEIDNDDLIAKQLGVNEVPYKVQEYLLQRADAVVSEANKLDISYQDKNNLQILSEEIIGLVCNDDACLGSSISNDSYTIP